MGANHSSDSEAGECSGRGEEVKAASYYEILGVEPQSTDEEIKNAYRKKALELHPDRNYGNVEQTTKLFADVQSAYEILSDPQERAWYDSHKDVIMRHGQGESGQQYERDVRMTTAEDIVKMFMTFDGHLDYSNSPAGFYNTLGKLFDRLSDEERMASEWEGKEWTQYPSFGSARESYDNRVKSFYATWSSFATGKSFSWKDTYRYSEAPDRRVRRVMERENKRLRDNGVREFNEAVRALVTFVKKRDPRFTPNKQSEVQRQKGLRETSAAQAARSRAANEAKLLQETIPEWTRLKDPNEAEIEEEEQEEEPQECFECVICRKIFKSERQYEVHEMSKKHVKAVQQLQRIMQKDNEKFGLNNDIDRRPSVANVAIKVDKSKSLLEEVERNSSRTASARYRVTYASLPTNIWSPSSPLEENDASEVTSGSSSGDEYESREKVEDRILDFDLSDNDAAEDPLGSKGSSMEVATERHSNNSSANDTLRIGKAKEKRAKKGAQSSAGVNGPDPEYKCAACQVEFTSETRLFTHTKDKHHARPVPKTVKATKGKKR